MAMMDDIKANVARWNDEGEVADYLRKILHKEAFDKSGLIYGMGHAIYSLSDPRAVLFEGFVSKLSEYNNRADEYRLYTSIARLAPEIIAAERRMYKGVSANIDFYSGFVYEMLELPRELFTPIFAISRIAGWSAHMLEEIVSGGRIIRPTYKSVAPKTAYVPLDERG
jgi:citrate synthase